MMKLCETCRYGSEYELDKPCIVYREDCPLYEKEGDGMNREEAIKILENERDNHINGCKGVFYETRTEAIDMAIKALEQDNCPYYVIDEDGHGLCKNHRYMEDVLGKITDEIKKIVDEETKHDEKWARGLHYSLCIIDKYIKESEDKDANSN